MDESKQQEFNPWVRMWISPRATMRVLLDTDPKKDVLLLMIAAGLGTYLSASIAKGLGGFLSLSSIIILTLVFGPVMGFIRLYIGAALLRWTGSWIGGKGNAIQVRSALAWSMVPEVLLLIILGIAIVIFGNTLFLSSALQGETSVYVPLFVQGFRIVRILLSIWGVAILVVCLSEVQKFSLWKSLANLLLSTLVVIVPAIIILALLFYSAGLPFSFFPR